MILDSSSVDFGALPPPDVLIVGSGPVGLTLAAALEAHGLGVMIVEAGSQRPDQHLQDDLEARFIGASLSGLTVGRTRQIGGGLNLWGGQLALIEPADLCRNDEAAVLNWPIDVGQLYSCLPETLQLLGADVHFDFNAPSIQHEIGRARSYGLNIIQTAWLRYPKLSRRFWTNLRDSNSTRLVYNLVCTGLEYDRRSNRVRGIAATSQSGRRVILRARETVLVAGSVENARLLLLPTHDRELPPWHRCQWLGGGFSEHIDATTASVQILDRRRMAEIFDLFVHRGVKYSPKVVWSTASRSSHPISACGSLFWPGNFRNGLSELYHLGKALVVQHEPALLSSLPKAIYASAKQLLPLAYRYARQRRIGTFVDRKAYLRVSTEQPARTESRITLAVNEPDRFGIPRPVVNWVRGREELANLRSFTFAVKSWLEGEGVGQLEIDPRLAVNDTSFFDAADEGLHHAGTTRMGASMFDGVVDPQLRVHDVKGLSVCGASVFPSSGYANPTLTAMVLAVRLSNRLVKEINAG